MKTATFITLISLLVLSCAAKSAEDAQGEDQGQEDTVATNSVVEAETDANLQSYIDASKKGGKMSDGHSLDFVKPVLDKQFIYSFDAVEELNYGKVILLTSDLAIISFKYDGDNGYHMLDGEFMVVYERKSGLDKSNHLIESGSDFERHATAGYNEQIDMTSEIKELKDDENLLQVILKTKTHRYNFNTKITKYKNDDEEDVLMLSEFYVKHDGTLTADFVLQK
jgi:outer membrane lipoprotein-sorting protein